MLGASRRYALGIADAIFAPADFLEESLRWAADVVRGALVVERARARHRRCLGRRRSPAAGAIVQARTRGAALAPQRALELIDRARHRDAATRPSPPRTRSAPSCSSSDQLRAGLYAFDLVQRRAKRPVDAPSPPRPRRSRRSASSAPG